MTTSAWWCRASVPRRAYRGYTDADIEREVRALLDDSNADVLEHLQHQRDVLLEQAERRQQTIKAVEELMDAHRHGIQLTAQEQVEIFGTTAFSEEYAVEAEERWGDTDAWKQSQQRVSRFSKEDWIAIKADGDALLADLAQARRDGVEPGCAEANNLAARHRASIERFYDCGDEMHRNLVEMYLADERFTRFYDDVEPGLAQFVHDIVVASYP